jgi:NTE family protein
MKKDTKNTKKKVGLALGGGGWRGLAHIGVLKALEENNIPVDFIAGTSAGALMGGLYSYFGNVKELEEFVKNFGYKELFKIVADPKLKNGILKGEKLISFLNKITKNANIEDLKIPFKAVSTDLLTGKSYYFEKGNLSEAIKTSVSIPLLFNPTKKDGMLLIDGGATENIPVICAKEMGAEFLIASSLNTAYFPLKETQVTSSGKIGLISARALLNTLSDMLALRADVVIEPKIKQDKIGMGVGYFLEFVKEKDTIKVGEEATLEKIDEIKTKLDI